jgi:peptide/nickel transport system substrate-binding protein
LTVSCSLPEPYAPFLTYASIGILPKYLLESTTPATLAEDPFNRSPIGTGPFRLTRLEPSSATLRANDSYYFGRPLLDEISLRFYPDIESAAADLVRGEVQGLMVDLSINPTDFQALGTLDGVEEYVSNRSAYASLFLNNTTPPLNEPAVRRAVALAVDKNSMISGLLGGRGVPVDTPVPPGSWAFGDDLEVPEHDIGEARNLLDEAGWAESEDGTRTNGSTELRLTLLTDEDPLRGAVAEMIAEQLQDIGIETTVSQETSSDLVRDFLTPRNYQAAVFGWDPGPDPDPYPAWHSSQAQGAGRNIAGYASDAADEYMENGRQSFDNSERADLYRQFQSLFLEDAASVPLYSHLYTYFVSAEIKNVDPGLLFWPSSRFRNVNEWEVTAATQEIGS